MEHLLGVLVDHRDEFQQHPDRAQQLVAIGEQPASSSYDPAELAAWTMVANLVLNLDEFICKN